MLDLRPEPFYLLGGDRCHELRSYDRVRTGQRIYRGGTIKEWISSQDPEDMWAWLECDGRAFSVADYPELAKIYPGRVPDLRDQFLRGGTPAQVGQTAQDSVRSHYHSQPPHTNNFSGHLVSGAISGTASRQAYTDMWTDIGHG